jgi:tetratricopeptide (TPR) repeat protein
MLTLLAGYVLTKASKQPSVFQISMALVALAAVTLLHLPDFSRLSELRNDSVFADYSRNLLEEARLHDNRIVIVNDDSSYFGLHYSQNILGIDDHVAVIVASLLFHDWYLEKAQAFYPQFLLPNHKEIERSRVLDYSKDLLDPNLVNTAILLVDNYAAEKSHHITYFGLGRQTTSGQGISFDEKSLDVLTMGTVGSTQNLGPQGVSKGLLYSQYAQFYLAKGKADYEAGQQGQAIADWRSALKVVPYAYPALANICRLQKSSPECSDDHIAEVKMMSRGFY